MAPRHGDGRGGAAAASGQQAPSGSLAGQPAARGGAKNSGEGWCWVKMRGLVKEEMGRVLEAVEERRGEQIEKAEQHQAAMQREVWEGHLAPSGARFGD